MFGASLSLFNPLRASLGLLLFAAERVDGVHHQRALDAHRRPFKGQVMEQAGCVRGGVLETSDELTLPNHGRTQALRL